MILKKNRQTFRHVQVQGVTLQRMIWQDIGRRGVLAANKTAVISNSRQPCLPFIICSYQLVFVVGDFCTRPCLKLRSCRLCLPKVFCKACPPIVSNPFHESTTPWGRYFLCELYGHVRSQMVRFFSRLGIDRVWFCTLILNSVCFCSRSFFTNTNKTINKIPSRHQPRSLSLGTRMSRYL